MSAILVALGAAIGAPLRYLVDLFIRARTDSRFPLGTFVVNVAGSLLIGVLAGTAPPDGIMAFAGIGLAGALTTYSTFGYETVRLALDGVRLLALLNVTASICAGFSAGVGGYALARLLAG